MTSVGSADDELDREKPGKKAIAAYITTAQENHVGSCMGQSPWLEKEGTDGGGISVAEQMKHDRACFHLLQEERSWRAEATSYSF